MIEVPDNNLYVNGELIYFPEEGEELLVREVLHIEPRSEDRFHTVTSTDRVDVLAYRYYSPFVEDAGKYWWAIADANNIYDPLDLSELVGSEILIPNILRVRLQL